ncbi:MAG: hypothetical protein AAB538_04575, partial [Patescibacteria group bacterium]
VRTQPNSERHVLALAKDRRKTPQEGSVNTDKYPLDESWESMAARVHNPGFSPRRSEMTYEAVVGEAMLVSRKVFTPPQRRMRQKPKLRQSGRN